MVDREARRKYAELVRHFISGRMTNDEYEDRFHGIQVDKNDPTVRAISHEVWFLYDDMRTHRMTGRHRLDRTSRREIAKAVLFLQSDQEYEWPNDAFVVLMGCLATFAFPLAALIALASFPDQYALISRVGLVIGLLLLSSYVWVIGRTQRRWKETGDADAWPFRFETDLQEAARHPLLLNGGR